MTTAEVSNIHPIHPPAKFRLVSAADDLPEPIVWLWEGWLARGKFELVAGMKAAGKSTMVYSLFATITVGGKWPDGTRAALGDVLVWSAEDDFRDTILPRFMAAGGDKSKLYRVEGIETVPGKKRVFDPRNDMPAIQQLARQLPNLMGVLIDPVVAVSTGDSHKNAETRHDLQPLVDLAKETRAVVIGITHLTKNTAGRDPIERVTGSLAFGAVPRVVLFVAADEDRKQRRLLRAESNIGPSDGGYDFTMKQEPLPGFGMDAQRVEWGAALEGSARKLVDELTPKAPKETAVDMAEVWISTMLANGPVLSTEMRSAAEAGGPSWAAIKRAVPKMPLVVVEHVPGSTAWQWRKLANIGERVF